MIVKITKNTKNGKVEFYRNVNRGCLKGSAGEDIDQTDETIERIDFNKSYAGRILTYDLEKEKTNPFYDFAQSLTGEGQNKDRSPIECLSKIDFEKIEKYGGLTKYISSYGCKLRYTHVHDSFEKKDGDSSCTLEELIVNYKNAIMTADEVAEGLQLIQKHIRALQFHKKESLKKSFKNNKIPFKKVEIESEGIYRIEVSGKKMIWLYSFLDEDDLGKGKFDSYWKKYNYPELKTRIDKAIRDLSEKEWKGDIIARKVYGIVKNYNSCALNNNVKNDLEGYSIFLNEVLNLFRKYFPPKSNKSKGRSGNKDSRVAALVLNNKFGQKKFEYLYSEKFVFQQVWRHIVNQLVSGLIQYGKLHTYCVGNKENPIKEINSDTMQNIQVEETFKKHFFSSVIWSVDRLNYYFEYGGNKSNMLYTDKAQDILEELNSVDFADNVPRETIDGKGDFISKFVNKIENKEEQIKLYKRLSTGFSFIESEDSSEYLIGLLQEIFDNLYQIRIGVMHYDKGKLDFTRETRTNGKPMKQEKLKEHLRRDIDNVQVRFYEQIRSMNFVDYYEPKLINKVFHTCNLEFRLYSSTSSMIPSFKKIYSKGVNLLKGDHDKTLKWYLDNKGDIESKDAVSSYRNLLQLIYYHVYIPSVGEEDREGLVTPFIEKTIAWNKRKNEHKHNNKSQDIHAFRYNDMPQYNEKMSFFDYMKLLQRAQSDKEKKNTELGVKGEERKNYFSSFVQDIFVFSFADFLFKRLGPYEDELLKPRHQKLSSIQSDELALDNALKGIRMQVSEGLQREISIYPMLKLLDSKELNELQHQFIRYRTSMYDNLKLEDPDSIQKCNEIEEIIELIMFTKPVLEKEETYDKMFIKDFEPFIEGKQSNYGDLYVQSNLKASVLYKNIANMGYTGVMALYKDIFKDSYKVTKDDYERYMDQRDTKILQMQKEVQDLHAELVRKNNISKKDVSKLDRYKEQLLKVQEYNNLRKKITFESMYEIYQIHIQILARLASFAEDWERDMRFLLTALKENNKFEGDICVDSIFDNGNVVSGMKQIKGNNDFRLIYLLYNLDIYDDRQQMKSDKKKLWKIMQVRNSLAHVNHITQMAFKNNYQNSIEELINRVRQLLSYDIKKQNAVIPSIKKIFDDHQMSIEFKAVKDEGELKYKIKDIKTKKIRYLKKTKCEFVLIDAWDEDQIKRMKDLMLFQHSE